jgi:hypothetical protein
MEPKELLLGDLNLVGRYHFYLICRSTLSMMGEEKVSKSSMSKQMMITTLQFVAATGLPYPTVVRWAQTGVIPGVAKAETLRGPVWMIPQISLERFEDWRPKRGRPRKVLRKS